MLRLEIQFLLHECHGYVHLPQFQLLEMEQPEEAMRRQNDHFNKLLSILDMILHNRTQKLHQKVLLCLYLDEIPCHPVLHGSVRGIQKHALILNEANLQHKGSCEFLQ